MGLGFEPAANRQRKKDVMDTDKQLYRLFTAAPGQLYQLLGLPAPREVRARAETFKDVQTECDLVLEPAAEVEPARLVDFQAYRDKRFVPKVMLRCALYRLQHPARPLRATSSTWIVSSSRPRWTTADCFSRASITCRNFCGR